MITGFGSSCCCAILISPARCRRSRPDRSEFPAVAHDRQRHAAHRLDLGLGEELSAAAQVEAAGGEISLEAPDHGLGKAALSEAIEGVVDQGAADALFAPVGLD